jgi:hypothetical protein
VAVNHSEEQQLRSLQIRNGVKKEVSAHLPRTGVSSGQELPELTVCTPSILLADHEAPLFSEFVSIENSSNFTM